MVKNCRLFFFLLMLVAADAYSSVQMRCVSVAANGDASITWFNSSSTLGFHAYYIFHSTSAAGPFTVEDSVLVYANQAYTDITANANNSLAFYYVVLKSTVSGDVMSDTIQAIKLSVLNIGNNGYATLNWNLVHTPRLITNSPYYRVYRKYTTSGWVFLDSVDIRINTPSYLEEITNCGDTVKYRIEVEDISGCISVSNVDGKYFRDVRPPQVPIVDSTSMDAGGFAVIGWGQNPSADTKEYVVLQLIGSNWIQVGDTLHAIDSTFMLTTVDVSSVSEQFRVLAIDGCGNPSAMSLPHRTLLIGGTLNRCNSTFLLSWNSYINGAFSSPGYEVIMNINGGPDSILTATQATSYLVTGLIADTTYCFHLMAILGGTSTSTSNKICITPNLPVDPLFSYIRKVSVTGTDEITVEAFVDTAADIYKYSLLRSAFPNGPFLTVTTIPATSSPFISFTDNVTTDRDYYYRVNSFDSCNYVAFTSQTSRSIYLNAITNENYTNSLSWNNYELWDAGVSQYVLQRYTDNGYAWSNITTIPYGNDSSYIDVINNIISADGMFCYRLMAVEGGGNQYGFTDSLYSNEICVQQIPAVFFPTAFHPGGKSGPFKPYSTFLSSDNYHLKIYNRFGELIFETKHYYEGWDGTFFGHGSPEGIYVYVLNAKGGDGVDIKRIGSFSLIR